MAFYGILKHNNAWLNIASQTPNQREHFRFQEISLFAVRSTCILYLKPEIYISARKPKYQFLCIPAIIYNKQTTSSGPIISPGNILFKAYFTHG